MSSWEIPSHLPALDADAIHVWQASIAALAQCEPYFDRLLDAEERARGNRYHAAADRARHIVSRGILRALAAHYLDVDARALHFAQGPFGKPHLAASSHAALTFNLSHSGDVVLLAFACNGEVGIDVEHWNDRLDDQARARLAESAFSVQESTTLHALPLGQRETAFYATWSRKEAYLKGTGLGVSGGLTHFTVTASDDVRLIADHRHPAHVLQWRLHDIDVGDGYSAALAANPPHRRVEHWIAAPPLFSGAASA